MCPTPISRQRGALTCSSLPQWGNPHFGLVPGPCGAERWQSARSVCSSAATQVWIGCLTQPWCLFAVIFCIYMTVIPQNICYLLVFPLNCENDISCNSCKIPSSISCDPTLWRLEVQNTLKLLAVIKGCYIFLVDNFSKIFRHNQHNPPFMLEVDWPHTTILVTCNYRKKKKIIMTLLWDSFMSIRLKNPFIKVSKPFSHTGKIFQSLWQLGFMQF